MAQGSIQWSEYYSTALSSATQKFHMSSQRLSKAATALEDLATPLPDARAYSCNNVAGVLGGLMFAE